MAQGRPEGLGATLLNRLLEFRSGAEPSRKYLLPLPDLLPERFHFPLVASNLHIEFLPGAEFSPSEFG